MAKTSDLTRNITSGAPEARSFSDSDRRAGKEPGTRGTPPVREETDDARQAETSHALRYMLAIGLAGVIVAFAIIYFVFVAV